jgi:asparagine synthase (glutamine-hydrolysing)
MCGIAGIGLVAGERVPGDLVDRMRDAMAHRGPDDAGTHCDGAVGLANRRLAIIDLSEAGHQPMCNEDGSVWLAYNGEIYNFRELREELVGLGHTFSSNTDTEVVLHAYESWGLDCLLKFNGMFAFCLWDTREKVLLMARDRFGIKPLYYSYIPGRKIAFASEIKALLQDPALRPVVDRQALREYFTFQNIYSDRTLFEGVRMLPAGHWMRFDTSSGELRLGRYWDFDPQAALSPSDLARGECAAELRGIFEQGVRRQLVSEVPLGSFLSGGMDSGSIVAVASNEIERLMTFTGGFDLRNVEGLEAAYDERDAAELIASCFSTEHYEMVLHAGDMQWVMPRLIWHLEDLRLGMCYQNYFIQRLASRFVKVVLSGAGGDELFGGYPWRYVRLLGCSGDDDFYRRYYDYWQRLVPEAEHPELFSRGLMECTRSYSPRDTYMEVFECGDDAVKSVDFINRALYFELKTFLHGLFVIADKMSMAHSLEARVPFLDNDLVDFAMKVPAEFKFASDADVRQVDENITGLKHMFYLESDEGKRILREAMKGLIPEEVLVRKKQGFSPPDGSWYRGPTMGYIKRILLDGSSLDRGHFNPDYIARIVEEHTTGRRNHRLLIWSLLSFEWWCRVWIDGGGSRPA